MEPDRSVYSNLSGVLQIPDRFCNVLISDSRSSVTAGLHIVQHRI